jgi:hypothetical protein
MRLEDYWGVGPKTAAGLRESLGESAALSAIESADMRTLVDAGVPRGRVVRILRRADGTEGLDRLGTRDARQVYDDLLTLAGERALTRGAEDRIRVLTPLTDVEARERRLDRVLAATAAWRSLDDGDRTAVEDAFAAYDDDAESKRSAVRTALTLRGTSVVDAGPFERLATLDDATLEAAVEALGRVTETEDGYRVAGGVDAELDARREALSAAESLAADALDLLERIREDGVRDIEDFREAFVRVVAAETPLDRAFVRGATADDAVDGTDFVSTSLRRLVEAAEERVDERETAVGEDLAAAVEDAREDVDAAVAAIDDAAFLLSLARFVDAFDLTRPSLVDDGLAVVDARNLLLAAEGTAVQPVSYGVGDHEFEGVPDGDRVAVLTGANSGGKTTLLETLCQVTLLAAMGLPVPAERAAVGRFDGVVFHRRHASFNAGVLESTLKSIVPPLTGEGRTLMLVDEFEAITEPGRAADLLNGLVELTVDRGALGVYVTHLADDLSPLPPAARIDGIFAEGLTEDLELRVDYQPRFGTVGKSTPEFIVSRLVANARDRSERAGFEALAAAVGEEAVQRTLSDAAWNE